ncbi:MAG: ferrous iron transport protein B [Metallibacterium scheffleri]|uniref:ferrous iron transport protein B n=1 Tax=Metallibacterium scheffleri TaxID=993689 RepID=UPI0026EACA64|nr:ferrous iron transport protein B [Metallibacterium scheffleri]MCK9366118.1 ferrous iron transport protein B [Metallibacterium scheffleri]
MNTLRIALVGNPNCGKTALFNLLTGSRQKVANYAGVTVERKEGSYVSPSGRRVEVLDLPGAYSLEATSPDEVITREICLGARAEIAPPDLIICVADATNLRLHLRFVLELRALGRPMLLALNQMDAARRRGIRIDSARLERELGMPVVPTVAVRRTGAAALVAALDGPLPLSPPPAPAELHVEVRRLLHDAVEMPAGMGLLEERLDRVLLHPVAGLLILAGMLLLMFQAVFAWAAPLMDTIEWGVNALGAWVRAVMPPGALASLLGDGVIAGAGSVLVFLPQILILFLFILVLEESGYLPRAAFLLDRLMRGAGLSGRAFIPLLSSFACAVPGIMATRSIENPRERMATIMVAPLMTCSARLPIYALLIAAFVPQRAVWRMFNLQGLVLFMLYAAGIVSALLVAFVLKRFGGKAAAAHLLMELPAYRMPRLRNLALGLWERARIFIKRVGGNILALTIVLWFLASYPAPPVGATLPAIDYSFAGQIGHWLQPIFAPLGFSWEIVVALIPGMAAREVAVGALATVYAVGGGGGESALATAIAAQWSLATAFALLAWYVFAPQCIATLAVIRRETNSWRIVGWATGYLFALAYAAAFATYQLTRWLT